MCWGFNLMKSHHQSMSVRPTAVNHISMSHCDDY